jgi:hypothetical protein
VSNVTSWLDDAEHCLARDDCRGSVEGLELALWSLTHGRDADPEGVARLERQLADVARCASGRVARRARRLKLEMGQAEVRWTLAHGARPDETGRSQASWSGVGWTLFLGALAGGLIGSVIGRTEYGSGFPGLDEEVGFIFGVPVGMVIALFLYAAWTTSRS